MIAMVMAPLFVSCMSNLAGRDQTSDDAYWNDKSWIVHLYRSVQSQIQYPKDMASAIPGNGVVTVRFTYSQGHLDNPEIIKTTGSDALDTAVLEQLRTMKAPVASGTKAGIAHAFQMSLMLTSPPNAFENQLIAEVYKKRFYPRSAIINREQGEVTISFWYEDGKLTDPQVEQSSGSAVLDQAAIETVSEASMPPVPDTIRGKKLRLSLSICYSMGQRTCPITELQVEDVEPATPTQPNSPSSGP